MIRALTILGAVGVIAGCTDDGGSDGLILPEPYSDRADVYFDLLFDNYLSDPNPVVPTTGTASYLGLAGMNVVADGMLFGAIADAAIAVNYDAKTMTGRIDAVTVNDDTVLPGDFELSNGSLSGDRMFYDVDGTLDYGGESYVFSEDGQSGSLSGPTGENANLTLRLNGAASSGATASIEASDVVLVRQ